MRAARRACRARVRHLRAATTARWHTVDDWLQVDHEQKVMEKLKHELVKQSAEQIPISFERDTPSARQARQGKGGGGEEGKGSQVQPAEAVGPESDV